MQAITKIESLPNELLIECFEYLHAIDIFHSFDDLNRRFSALIRSIPLRLSVGRVEKSKLIQFGQKLLSSSHIKNQVKSLIVTKKGAFANLQTLFSFIPLNEFTQLQALIFSYLNISSNDEILSMLPLLPYLRYFCVGDVSDSKNQILQSLSRSTVKILSLEKIPERASFNYSFMSLTHLTISQCSINELYQFFKHSPILKCLNINYLSSSSGRNSNKSKAQHGQAIHLQRLVVDNCYDGFDTFELLLRQTTNLRFLMLHSYDDVNMADATRWRKLISDALGLLNVFKFIFHCPTKDDDDDHSIIDKFQIFQTGFWHERHQWYTEYVINQDEAIIYTIPYMLDSYEIIFNGKRHYSHSLSSANIFQKVTDLKVNIGSIVDNDQYYFPNVKSLSLNNVTDDANHDYRYLNFEDVQCLKTMINLCNLTHLEISLTFQWESPSFILQLIKEASNISSLKADKTILMELWKNRQLCEWFKTIRKLDIVVHEWNMDVNGEDIIKISQIFNNMEKFRCEINRLDILQATIRRLSRLSSMKTFIYKTFCRKCADWWQNAHESELDVYPFTIDCEYEFDADHAAAADDDDFAMDYWTDYHHLYSDVAEEILLSSRSYQ